MASKLRQILRNRLATYRQRAFALLIINLVAFLVFGRAAILPGVPDDEWGTLDRWVRNAVFAVVRPSDTSPVTYIDINNALYRDTWGMPVVTPRIELLKILQALDGSGAALIAVDIDLAWGEKDAALDNYIRGYRGPPLVLVRHLETANSHIIDVATPYDESVAQSEGHVLWAHAYFYADGDGALREWLPWQAYCHDGEPRLLPSVAAIRGDSPAPELQNADECPTADELPALPIIYTDQFGFAGTNPDDEADVAIWMEDPFGPARKVDARVLLDNSPIDKNALFGNRTVVIGGSHTAGQDLRLTPIGVLPGAVVQANTIIHAEAQLASADTSEPALRLIVVVLFLILALLAFWVGALLLVAYAVAAVGLFSAYGAIAHVELAALLYVQFRFLAWIAEPFWKAGLGILLPDYLQEEEE